jgi:integrase
VSLHDVRPETEIVDSSACAKQCPLSDISIARQITARMSEAATEAELCVSASSPGIAGGPECATLGNATSLVTEKRGPVAKRRFQKGNFALDGRGNMYSLFYEDVQGPDGFLKSKRVRICIGNLSEMSERAGRREHARIMENVNRKRGSVAPTVKGQSFGDLVSAWRSAVAPNLSPATVRQSESYLRKHVLPRFKSEAPQTLNVSALQLFATELRKSLSRKTVINILSSVFAILDYAKRCGTVVSSVSFKDIELGSATTKQAAFFTREQASQIIAESQEPYKTMFAVAWATGLRAGELLALNVADLNFNRRTICVSKSSDDNTRDIRQPKTPKSVAYLPMPSALEDLLRNYLKHHWTANESGLLFPNRKGTKPRWRDNVVKYGLKPVLRKLGIQMQDVGLHAFRHGLATELVDTNIPLTALQAQMRHADVRTTLRIYAHAIPASQRDAIERLAGNSIGTNVPVGTETNNQVVYKQ